MEFAGVKEWRIPEGNVMKVERNGVTLWERPVTTRLLTAEDFNAAQKMARTNTFTYTVLTNQVDGTDGFSIKGRNGEQSALPLLANGSFVFRLNLTDFSCLKFYAKKAVDHGCITVRITDEEPTLESERSDAETLINLFYSNAPTSWTEYEFDISSYKGYQYILFQGGYGDWSGRTTSETQYCNIRFEK